MAWEYESLFLNISFSKHLIVTDEVCVTPSSALPRIITDHSSTRKQVTHIYDNDFQNCFSALIFVFLASGSPSCSFSRRIFVFQQPRGTNLLLFLQCCCLMKWAHAGCRKRYFLLKTMWLSFICFIEKKKKAQNKTKTPGRCIQSVGLKTFNLKVFKSNLEKDYRIQSSLMYRTLVFIMGSCILDQINKTLNIMFIFNTLPRILC